ncbi:MAG TPA: glycoside hydrolase family 2 TIM barrel-domain containing protein [Armatimonadota bacterium]|jgi:beta-glucuronidase
MFTHDRPHLDLNGTWRFCPDPMQRCRGQQWWRKPPIPNSVFPCWDPEGMWEIQVPGTWKTQFEKLEWFDGHAVYLKEFDAELPADHEAFLVFDGVVYEAEVYLNGQLIGKHEWGYSPFRLRVTETLQAHNQLFVLVDNHLSPNRVPSIRFDWNNDGGIINPVKLVFVPRTHIENFRTQTTLTGDEAVLEVTIQLASRDTRACLPVTVRIPELGLAHTVDVKVAAPTTVEFRVPRSEIELWCPENPRLYQTELSTPLETVADEIGYREIRREGKRIMLNGKPIRLYGMCVHSDFPGTGRTATPEGVAAMIAHAQELGMNFLRCAHYPYAEIFGRALDRAGIMWWEETPAYWTGNMAEPSQTAKGSGILSDAIQRDWNRASLIIWSVSNECCWRNPDDPEDNNYPYWFSIVPLVRQLDPSRLISCAEAGNMIAVSPVWTPGQADEFDRRTDEAQQWRPGHTDELYDLFDVLSANLYVGPAEAPVAYARYVEMMSPYNKPMILSEFGSMSLREAEVADDVLGSEVRHAMVLREAYDVFATLEDLTGYCPWCLSDIRCPLHWRWYNSGKAVFRYGFVDETWTKKTTVYQALKNAIAGLRRHWGD